MTKHYAAPAWARLDAAIREARSQILGGAAGGTGDRQLAEAEEAERRRRLLSLAGGWAEQSRIEALLGEVRRRLDCDHLPGEDRDALLAWMAWAEGVAASLSPFQGGVGGLPNLPMFATAGAGGRARCLCSAPRRFRRASAPLYCRLVAKRPTTQWGSTRGSGVLLSSQIIQKLRHRLHPRHQQALPRPGAGDVQQVPLDVVDIL